MHHLHATFGFAALANRSAGMNSTANMDKAVGLQIRVEKLLTN